MQRNNEKITNVNHLTNLKILNCSDNCGMDKKELRIYN